MIDKNTVTPLYVQVSNELRMEILSNQYGENGCIGTHTNLAKRFNVSIRTIREAVQILEREGLVEIRQGKGTFVRRKVLVDQMQELNGIMKMLDEFNIKKQVKAIQFSLVDTPEWMDSELKSWFGRKTLFIQRLVTVGTEPLCSADIYLPEKFCYGIEKKDIETKTIYQILQGKFNVELGKGKQFIRAGGASERIAKALHIAENSPVLELERKAYDKQGDLIEYMLLTYEASKYCFEVELNLNKED